MSGYAADSGPRHTRSVRESLEAGEPREPGEPGGSGEAAAIPRTLARAGSGAGEVALRRRGPFLELVVDGRFAMDTTDTSTEAALAETALSQHPRPARVLVGGLGLGYTLRAVLADPRVHEVDVVELAEPLIAWARQGLVPELTGPVRDPRTRLHPGDVADTLRGRGAARGPWDVVLLDVDNGPGFLLRDANAWLYAEPGLAAAAHRLRVGGLLAIWSSHRSPVLLASLREVARHGDDVAESVLRVRREGRDLDYALYTLARRD